MQQRAGLLFISKKTGRIFLVLEESKWTVPTFVRCRSLLEDAEELLARYSSGRVLPIELYVSADQGFEYGSYVCLVEDEFLGSQDETICWANLDLLPKQIHTGLKNSLNNQLTRTKLDTIMVMSNDT